MLPIPHRLQVDVIRHDHGDIGPPLFGPMLELNGFQQIIRYGSLYQWFLMEKRFPPVVNIPGHSRL